MCTYQGRLADGSRVQKHSAGANYPYVVGSRERVEMPWFVWAPDGTEAVFQTCKAAMGFACAAAAVYH